MKTSTSPAVAYEVHGEDGPPVLFIMGLAMPGAVWGPNVAALSEDHRCGVYDHLGLGDSDDPKGPVTMESMADDALRVLDALGWATAHVVGVSMGGMIAQELALRAEDRCRSLSLIATHGGGIPARLPTPQGARAFLETLATRDRGRGLEKLLYPEAFLRTLDEATRRGAVSLRLQRPAPLRTVLRQLGAVARHRTERRLKRLRLPTLIVRPGADILVRPTASDRLARAIPHARVVRFDDAGHGVLFQAADDLHRALREHIRGAEG